MKNNRCAWVTSDPIYAHYHDTEWGVPVHDDQKHFEFLVLEASQAGLSWLTILKRREGYRKAFQGFDPLKVSKFNQKDLEKLILNSEIIRNRQKIEAAINNSKRFLEIQNKFNSFDHYVWRFVDGRPIVNKRKTIKNIPATSKESDALSKDLKENGFKFIGSTIIYAHMQAVGMVNDHTTDCFRYGEVGAINKKLLPG